MTTGTLRLAFLDIVFNLLLGITVMFIVSFLLINPPQDGGKVDPPIKFMVEMEWSQDSEVDIDLWVRGHGGDWTGFSRKDGSYFILERDDRGTQNDTIEVNGERVVIKRNYENIRFTILPAGEYFVNVHYFSGSGIPELVEVKLTMIEPFKSIWSGEVLVSPRQEETVVSFIVDEDGKITELRTDIQLPHAGLGSGGPAGEVPW